MGPILQYLLGVPFGLFALIGGIIGAYKAFTNTMENKNNNGFIPGLCALGFSVFGLFVLKAILFDGLSFSGAGRY